MIKKEEITTIQISKFTKEKLDRIVDKKDIDSAFEILSKSHLELNKSGGII